MGDNIIFQGEVPFHLPSAQRATATAVDDTVVVTLYALVPGQGPDPVPIETRMGYKTAYELANGLTAAARHAESKARHS